MFVKVSSKGQIVLPAEVRKRFHIKTGDELVLVEWGNAIYIVPKSDDPIRDAHGILKRLGTSDYSWEQYKAERKAEEERRDRKLLGLSDE